ncbi:hypothetical protein [Mycobacterium servetii]|uniref:Uncharacterized protein n=1 Tax=Mycobacterium servetii TaxID=3237418 RepID=A0ABV4C441_9MYCO
MPSWQSRSAGWARAPGLDCNWRPVGSTSEALTLSPNPMTSYSTPEPPAAAVPAELYRATTTVPSTFWWSSVTTDPQSRFDESQRAHGVALMDLNAGKGGGPRVGAGRRRHQDANRARDQQREPDRQAMAEVASEVPLNRAVSCVRRVCGTGYPAASA